MLTIKESSKTSKALCRV